MAFRSLQLSALTIIGRFSRTSSRLFVGSLVAGLLLGLGACGSDDEKSETTATSPPATQEETVTEEQETETEAETGVEPPATETEPGTAAPSPEDEQGGAGDEEPARTLALFTAGGGQIKPRLVRVPPFISIRVELRARDGNSYGLAFAGKTIEVSDGLGSVSTTFDGLRPGEVLVGQVMGAPGRVRIAATAEPGP